MQRCTVTAGEAVDCSPERWAGSYEAIIAGTGTEALHYLTGGTKGARELFIGAACIALCVPVTCCSQGTWTTLGTA